MRINKKVKNHQVCLQIYLSLKTIAFWNGLSCTDIWNHSSSSFKRCIKMKVKCRNLLHSLESLRGKKKLMVKVNGQETEIQWVL